MRIKGGLLTAVLVMVFCIRASAQAPDGISYQAVLRDADGKVLANQAATLRLSLSGSDGATIYYSETHSVLTDALGMVKVVFGGGQLETGSFGAVPWSSGGPIHLKVEVKLDGQTAYTQMGSEQLQSVPYALHAANGQPMEWLGTLASPPVSPTLNQAYYNSTDGKSYVWDGDSWEMLAQDGLPGAQGPTGPQGPQGPAGTGLTNRGAWVSGSTYQPSDYVFASNPAQTANSMWIVQGDESFVSTVEPRLDATHWVEFQAPEGPQGPAGISIQWLGTLPVAPINPTLNQAYYNSAEKRAYVWDGDSWEVLAQDGLPGAQGPAGPQGQQGLQGPVGPAGVSIQWLGTLPVAPISPTLNQAYYSSTDGKSYVWDGDSWELLAQDGEPGPAGPLTPGAAGQTLRHDGSTWVASGLLTNNGTNVGVNTDAPTRQLDVNGDQRLRGQLYDNTNLAGNSGQFLGNNGSGILWQNLPEGLHGTGEAGTMAIWEGSGSLAGLPNMTFSSSLSVVGSPTANPDDPIFEVKNSAGEIIFGVYQEGVRINIKDGAITKGLKGGFAVGGLTNQTKAGPVEYLRITSDSARIYVKQTPTTKGLKGGFAVGGLTNQTKGVVSQDMLFVAPDSARIYVKEAGTKGVKGGFAVGGLTNQTKAPNAQFLTLTPDNYLIGYEAGKSITTGLYNSFMGYQNGYSNTTGYMNYFIGYRAGYNNLSGYSNVFIGDSAGFNNTSGYKNIVIGNKSGFSNVAGKYNVFLGYNAGYANNADYNVFLGYEAGKNNTSGITNSFVGYQAGYSNTTGEKNVANGYQALYSNTGGSFNTAIGNKALYSNANGQSNTATGSYSLNSNTSGSGNIAYGAFSLQSNTNGGGNSACGYSALSHNTIGNDNTAIGNSALLFNVNGNYNSALGSYALNKNSSGSYNIANGYNALFSNTTGNSNIAIGVGALYTTTGNGNIAVGYQTLYQNNTGYSNVASGNSALYNNKAGHDNVAIGDNAGQGASNIDFIQCTFVGAATNLTTARTNVTMLGAGISNGQCTADNQVLLGSTAVSQIRAQVSSITAYSDARMKFNVKDDVKGLDFIMKLKPVTYNEDPTLLHRIWGTPDSLLKNMDHSQIKRQRFIGFLAQDVEKAAKESGFDFPGIDVPKNEKEVYSLRYVDFIMPMIKGMQEQQQMINEQKTMINEQHKRIEQLEEEINKLKELMMK